MNTNLSGGRRLVWSELSDHTKNNLRDAGLSGADLRGADLSYADLREVNLDGADLSGADLRWADLFGANLSDADLSGADLIGANLSGADLRWADLRDADLGSANLSEAGLSGADLREVNLRWADLSEADLSDANLRGANLRGADLSEADLRWTDLTGARWDNYTIWPEGFIWAPTKARKETEMAKVERIKVWKKNWNGHDGYNTETRVYIDMSDGRRGGLFVTGNPYQDAGDIDGQLTVKDVEEALKLAGGSWKTMYEEDVEAAYAALNTGDEEDDDDNHAFFSAFFGGERERKCCKCGTVENLLVVSNDSETYICEVCLAEQKNRTYSAGHDITEEAAREYAFFNRGGWSHE